MQASNTHSTDTYIVTGASSGIGEATAIALAQRKMHVLAIARRASLLAVLADKHPEFITAISADLGTDDGIEQVADAAKHAKSIKGIVHAAGTVVELAEYQQTDNHKLTEHFAVHVGAPISLNNALGQQLNGARVVFIDSYSAKAPRIGWASYSIVKAAAQMAARCAAAELTHATVVRVFPGAVNTPLVESVLKSKQSSATVEAFKEIEVNDNLTNASDTGAFLANILTSASATELQQREVWDYNNPDDHIFA